MRLEVEQVIGEKRIKEIVTAINGKKMTKSAGVREMFAGGLSVQTISDTTGIRYTHVYNIVRNEILINGLEVVDVGHKKGNGVQKEQILELLRQGKTLTEVSAELKVIYNRVWQVAKEAGLTKKQQEQASTAVVEVKEAK